MNPNKTAIRATLLLIITSPLSSAGALNVHAPPITSTGLNRPLTIGQAPGHGSARWQELGVG